MKSLLPVILIVSYVTIGVLSIFGMHSSGDFQMHGGGMVSDNCIASIAAGVDCPTQADPVAFALFHLNAYKGFSLATVGGGTADALALAFMSLFAIGFVFLSFLFLLFFKSPQPALYRQRLRNSFSPPRTHALTRWLSLHEMSPSYR